VAGDHLGVPRIVSHPMFPIVSPEHVRSDEEWDLPAPHPAEAQERFEASWRAIAQRWGVELGDTVGIIHSAWTSETVVAFTTEEMVGDWGLPDGWHCIGPLLEPPPPRVPAGERPLVYVCFGTSFNGRPELFRAVVEGVRDEPYDVLVSMGDGRLSADDLGPLPANVVVRDFVPGRDMLARAAVHVTHGGNNSVHESLLAGVPMLFIPQAYDQFPLAWRVDQLGAGAVAAEDPANIRAGIRWLIEDESPTKRANELAQHLVDFDGEARVAALIEGVLAGDEALSA
jgi:MGT family glycosyltransferase